jgi:hypothetical protein
MAKIDKPFEHSSGPPHYAPERTDEAAALYEAVYAEAKRSLEGQTAALDEIRQRAGMFLAFVGSATAFLVGAAVQAKVPPSFASVHGLVIAALVATGAASVAACVILVPARRWQEELSAEALITGWVETDIPMTRIWFFRELALVYDEMRLANRPTLVLRQWTFAGLVVFGVLQVALWSCVVVLHH